MGPRVDQVSGPKSTDTQVKVDVITAQKGDTLEKISKREGIPLDDLKDANPKMNPKQALGQGQDVQYPKDLLVQRGEKSLDQVADRLGLRSRQALRDANKDIKNPDNLREGQHIRLPKDFGKVEQRGTAIKQKTISKGAVNLPGGAGQVRGGQGGVVYRPPSVKIVGINIPVPDIVITDGKGPGVNSTDGKYDGTGPANTTRRREEDKNIYNTRQRDERDLDPNKDKKKPKIEKGPLPTDKSPNKEIKLEIRKSYDPQQLDEELKKRRQEEAAKPGR
jgi:murein DD-endopeptidase MepM/ murein hydrolase activator NlpD